MIFLDVSINSKIIFAFKGLNLFLHLPSQIALMAELVDLPAGRQARWDSNLILNLCLK